MSVSHEFLEYISELLSPLGDISTRRMFGGAGVYSSGLMFGLVADDRLYMKVDDQNRTTFERQGLGPFLFRGHDGVAKPMSYYELPESALEDADELVEWGRSGLEAALRAQKKKGQKKKVRK